LWHFYLVGASRFQWTNPHGQDLKVIVQDGSMTQVRQILPNSDAWLESIGVPQAYRCFPNAKMECSFSVAPTSISSISMDGI
jgi:hypothetical protein